MCMDGLRGREGEIDGNGRGCKKECEGSIVGSDSLTVCSLLTGSGENGNDSLREGGKARKHNDTYSIVWIREKGGDFY